MISRGGGGGMAVRIMQQDIIIVQAMSDWPNDIISTAPVSLTVDRDECFRVVGILVMVE